jgi:hypothetical protein
MHRTHFLASLVLIAGLIAPVSAIAAPGKAGVSVRVYDKDHKDYHNWDDYENKQWGVYLSQNHKKYHEYSKSNTKEQSNYWNWRHGHN